MHIDEIRPGKDQLIGREKTAALFDIIEVVLQLVSDSLNSSRIIFTGCLVEYPVSLYNIIEISTIP
jgi:hypothetical protein